MEVFKAIIELVDKIGWMGWPITVLIVFFSLKIPLINFISLILSTMEKRGGKIEMSCGSIEFFKYEEKLETPEEAK
ncbi:MAG: hypothetical protein ABIJ30_02020 [bacterium]